MDGIFLVFARKAFQQYSNENKLFGEVDFLLLRFFFRFYIFPDFLKVILSQLQEISMEFYT